MSVCVGLALTTNLHKHINKVGGLNVKKSITIKAGRGEGGTMKTRSKREQARDPPPPREQQL